MPGAAGQQGNDGDDGIDAYTFLSAPFIQPAIGGNTTVALLNSLWITPGQIVYVAKGGYYQVINTPNSLSASLQNLGYDGNAAPGDPVATGGKVSPGGLVGPAGAEGEVVQGVFYNNGDPNGIVTATRPALCYGPNGELWVKVNAINDDTNWINLIAAGP